MTDVENVLAPGRLGIHVLFEVHVLIEEIL